MSHLLSPTVAQGREAAGEGVPVGFRGAFSRGALPFTSLKTALRVASGLLFFIFLLEILINGDKRGRKVGKEKKKKEPKTTVKAPIKKKKK